MRGRPAKGIIAKEAEPQSQNQVGLSQKGGGEMSDKLNYWLFCAKCEQFFAYQYRMELLKCPNCGKPISEVLANPRAYLRLKRRKERIDKKMRKNLLKK